MPEIQVNVTIPTTSYTTVFEPIFGGYKIHFYWYPNHSTWVSISPCTTYPSISSSPDGSGGTNITITCDDGSLSEEPKEPLSISSRTSSSKKKPTRS